jgi:hypothetical protein
MKATEITREAICGLNVELSTIDRIALTNELLKPIEKLLTYKNGKSVGYFDRQKVTDEVLRKTWDFISKLALHPEETSNVFSPFMTDGEGNAIYPQ